MIPAHTYTVIPRIPDRLKDLVRIAMNLGWTWDPEAIDLFRRLDPNQLLWERCYANPIKMLGLVSQERLGELISDEGFLAHLDRVGAKLSNYLERPTWFTLAYPEADYSTLPLTLERRPDGDPVTVEVEFPGRKLRAQVWRAQVGRVPLYLLDTDLKTNAAEDRGITERPTRRSRPASTCSRPT